MAGRRPIALHLKAVACAHLYLWAAYRQLPNDPGVWAVLRQGMLALHLVVTTRALQASLHVYLLHLVPCLHAHTQMYEVHIWFVAHPKQLKNWSGAPPDLYSISGSAHFMNKTDVGIVVHRCVPAQAVAVWATCGAVLFAHRLQGVGAFDATASAKIRHVRSSLHLLTLPLPLLVRPPCCYPQATPGPQHSRCRRPR